MSDQDPMNGDYYLELRDGIIQNGRSNAPPMAVTTDIEGGKPCEIQDIGRLDSGAKEDESMPGSAIMKTMVVEQSVVSVGK